MPTGADGEWKVDGVEPSRGRFVRLPFERLKQGGTFLGVLSPKLVEECLSLPTSRYGAPGAADEVRRCGAGRFPPFARVGAFLPL
jgi:hypothetical protein